MKKTLLFLVLFALPLFLMSKGAINNEGIKNNAFGDTGEAIEIAGPVDDTAPLWKTTFPFVDNIMAYSGDLNVNMDETGTVYFMVLADGSDSPTAEEVKAGIPFGTVTPIYPGSFEYSEANTDQIFIIKEATPGLAYDIYVVAEDNSGNLQSVPVLCEATTTAHGIKITYPGGGETFAVGTEITFTWESMGVTNLLIGGYDFNNQEHFLISEDGDGNAEPVAASLEAYTFTIPNDAALDSLAIFMADADLLTIRDSVAPIYLTDNVPPGIDILNPTNNAVNVPVGITPIIFFEEPVYKGTGKVYIKNESGGTLLEEFSIDAEGDGEALDFVDDNYGIKISPTATFIAGTKYYIEMDAGVVIDFFDNDFAGIAGSTTWSFTIEGTLSVKDDFINKIKVYPVPVSTELTITGYSKLRSIEILDLTGSRVFSTNQISEAEYKVDASLFPRGFYFLKLDTDAGMVTKKFIKK